MVLLLAGRLVGWLKVEAAAPPIDRSNRMSDERSVCVLCVCDVCVRLRVFELAD